MKTVLKKFIDESLFDACSALLHHLHIVFNEVTRVPVPFEDLYPLDLSKALDDVLAKVEYTYFIGTVDESSLTGSSETVSAEDVTARASEGKYTGMMIFAVELQNGATLTRSESTTLTRGFNRIASAQPVILFIKQGNELALSTCERSRYTQQWRDGEKLGKVSILRGINCLNPHRGHIDILASIGDKTYPNFEELYKHWIEVFSSDLLTKKFYSELSDWYAWAVQVVRFPNDLTTDTDDDKFNHESCIRLITRLIFVWFLKQKHLIPEEFFDERYIREHFIEEFNPHDRKNLLYDPEKSKYYRLILQNLFFAMLNSPIVAEDKAEPNKRKFRGDFQKGFLRDGYNVNNLMRYKSEFKEGGADEFVQMANSQVPFLNGGLFDCLDKKPEKLYYDGFSERKESLEQLYLPDWLFFGEEVGHGIDLSQWYGDNNKKHVSARGIIDILKRYNFTIEENTPLDQEVSLDPELLGKAFENLLASYNPETKTSARKQTGSFYTPREIVQYMVDESLVAHLKRTCGDELEPKYRKLLSYSSEETTLNAEQRKAIMQAIYNCRVLDPACGSGAFPMGVLQQLVHVLRQLDPTNEMWKEFMIDLAIEQSKLAFAEDEEAERKARLADIEEAFNTSINDPDYARKLYLIEHCVYGVDIQPIAVQISKLRFFISLVVDQKPTNDAAHNFGIRPLPNLESKFVAANTLIPVKYDGTLVESSDEVRKNKERLKELNHKIFLAKRNIDKQRLKDEINATRHALVQAIEDTGFVGHSEAELLAGWDMFEQNASSSFFDAEWMFGVKGGFDIVIGNPPYGARLSDTEKDLYRKIYPETQFKVDTYSLFVLLSLKLMRQDSVTYFIIPNTLLDNYYEDKVRHKILTQYRLLEVCDLSDSIFEAAVVHSMIIGYKREKGIQYDVTIKTETLDCPPSFIPHQYFVEQSQCCISYRNYKYQGLFDKLANDCVNLQEVLDIKQTIKTGNDKKYITTEKLADNFKPILRGKDICRYGYKYSGLYVNYGKHLANCIRYDIFEQPKILIREAGATIVATYDEDNYYIMSSLYNAIIKNEAYSLRYLLGLINSKVFQFLMNKITFEKTKGAFTKARIFHYYALPVKVVDSTTQNELVKMVDKALSVKRDDIKADIKTIEDEIDRFVYHLYNLTYDEVLIIDPETPITREEYEQ